MNVELVRPHAAGLGHAQRIGAQISREDTTADTGTTPPPGSLNVPRNTKVVITFSESMADDAGAYLLKDYVKLSTVAADGVTATDISSTAIQTVAIDTTKQVATVTLQSGFNSGTSAAP